MALSVELTSPAFNHTLRLRQLAEQKPGMLDELAAEWAKLLETENVELQKWAKQLAGEIKKTDEPKMKPATLGIVRATPLAER